MEAALQSKTTCCACGNVRKAARAVTQYYDNHLKSAGLRSTQFSLLLSVSQHEEAMMSELAELLAMDLTTLTRNLEVLKKLGFIEIHREKGDARKKLLSITGNGRAKLSEAMPLWEQAQTHIENGLGHKRLLGLLQVLTEVGLLTK
jgi:MarR family transcriptional regulator, organic hydroperoxide resistance regulator